MIVEAGGGVARHVADLCCGLHAKGVDVHLVYSPNRMDPVVDEGLRRLANLSISIKSIPMAHKPGFSDFAALWKIRKYAIKNGPFDIVHGHSSKGGALARLLFGAGIQAKVYSAHAFVTMKPDLSWLESSLYCLAERFLAHVGDAVIATSDTEQEHAEGFLGISSEKNFLIPNGIDMPTIDSRKVRRDLRYTWGVHDDEIVIGTVVRFDKQKAPEILLGAFANIAKRIDNVRLVMIGGGPMKEQLVMQAEGLGISHLIVWPGYVKDESLMAAFDIFALSSWYEGFPYVLLDALAVGLPLVATQVGGADMVINGGENGFIVPCGDVKEMSKALYLVSTNEKQRNQMGMASFLKAKSFSVSEMVEKTLDVYNFLLSSVRRENII
jgi:glycosyltransferase involved in cell wall biosynthesis